MSRRWVLRGSSAPPATISSASCGEKKRLSRPSRSSCSDLLVHALLQGRVPLRELGRLRVEPLRLLLRLVVERLDPEHGLHARHERRLVHGLCQVLVRAGLESGDDVPRFRPGGDEDDRHEGQ